MAAAKYLHALDDGEIPLLLLFTRHGLPRRPATGGLRGRTRSPGTRRPSYRLPVAVWRDVMDRYFPNSGWLRLGRDTLDALTRFKAARALPTWDDAIEQLLKEAGEEGV